MELVVDIGNTRIKIAVFINNGIHKVIKVDAWSKEVEEFIANYDVKQCIISSVKLKKDINPEWLKITQKTIWLDETTKVPYKNRYKTPETLGRDRMAAIVGGRFLEVNGAILCIDAGTCITYDLLTAKNEYLGGNISPGLHMRLKSLATFTGALPLVDLHESSILIGNSTKSAILTGVINGYRAEVNGVISAYNNKFHSLKVILCGGDAKYLVNHLEKEIFANRNLVLIGLHKILKHNT